MLEAKRSLIQLTREGALSAERYSTCVDALEQDVSRFLLRDLTLDLCASLVIPAVATPRSLDLAHLERRCGFTPPKKSIGL